MPWYAEWLILYLIIINVVGIIVTVYDKLAAKKHNWRVKEKTLFILSAVGAGVSIYITMLLIRHKTKHKSFMIGIPVIIILELIIAVCVYMLV